MGRPPQRQSPSNTGANAAACHSKNPRVKKTKKARPGWGQEKNRNGKVKIESDGKINYPDKEVFNPEKKNFNPEKKQFNPEKKQFNPYLEYIKPYKEYYGLYLEFLNP
jgi:hypothetical protein